MWTRVIFSWFNVCRYFRNVCWFREFSFNLLTNLHIFIYITIIIINGKRNYIQFIHFWGLIAQLASPQSGTFPFFIICLFFFNNTFFLLCFCSLLFVFIQLCEETRKKQNKTIENRIHRDYIKGSQNWNIIRDSC